MRNFARVVLVIMIFALCASLLVAQPAGNADRPGADLPDVVISEVRVQEFPPRMYLYVQQETTLTEIGHAVPMMFQSVWEAITAGDARIVGAPIFVYDGMTGGMDKPFTLQVGFPIEEGAKPEGDVMVRELEDYRCATVLFSGRLMDIAQAYQKLFTEMNEAGLEPAGGHREIHLHFESPDSPNNVVLIQVGLKE